MGYTGRVINGALRYRVLNSFKDHLHISSETVEQSLASRLKVHPCYLTLPPISIPAQLDNNAIAYLRDHSLSSPKSLEDRAKLLSDYLWSRELMTKEKILKKNLKKDCETLSVYDKNGSENNYVDGLENITPYTTQRNERVDKAYKLDTWKSLTYSGNNCELYLVCRLAPNFSAACRALYEIRKRCPNFIPRSLFDFGSGLGTVTWAANTVWPVGCIRDHHLVDASISMIRISEFLFSKILTQSTNETVFPGIYHRQFMPHNSRQSDLVVSAYTLIEQTDRTERCRIVSSLWNKTSNFLILIEQGNKAGFQAILEARDWLINNGGPDVNIFAPCPHSMSCGKAESICNLISRYYQMELSRTINDVKTELTSYLVVSRGDWRRHQSPVTIPEPVQIPRIVSYKLSKTHDTMQDICLPSGEVERVIFTKKATDKDLRYFMRNASSCDIGPMEIVDVNDEHLQLDVQTEDIDVNAEADSEIDAEERV